MSTNTEQRWSGGDSRETNPGIEREPARVIRSPGNGLIGVALLLNGDDLERLGITARNVDAVVPKVYNGAVLIEPIQGDSSR